MEKWLSERERRQAEPEAAGDLAEKGARAQQARHWLRELEAYRPVIEAAAERVRHLGGATASDEAQKALSAVERRHKALLEGAKEEEKAAEARVVEHRAFLDAGAAFEAFVRSAREQLSASADTYGGREAVEERLAQVRELSAGLSKGEELLEAAGRAMEAAAQHTSPAGQARLRGEAEAMRQQLTELRSDVKEAIGTLTKCEALWEEFGELEGELMSWDIQTCTD